MEKFSVEYVGDVLPKFSILYIGSLLTIIYLFLVRISAKQKDLTVGLTKEEMSSLPPVSAVNTGYHYILPIIVLLWCVLVNRLSPGLSAYWAMCSNDRNLTYPTSLKGLF